MTRLLTQLMRNEPLSTKDVDEIRAAINDAGKRPKRKKRRQ
jgi:hypothetical protein